MLGLVLAALLLSRAGCRQGRPPDRPELPAVEAFTSDDRVLIVAPHEDDETLATGGVIQQALAAGARVRVVYLTYGDHDQFAFIVYREKPWNRLGDPSAVFVQVRGPIQAGTESETRWHLLARSQGSR